MPLSDIKQNPAEAVDNLVGDFVAHSPLNKFRNEDRQVWEEYLLGFSAGDDPIYTSYKEHVGPFHFTPAEIFNLTFPDNPANGGELAVISWILLQNAQTKADNSKQTRFAAERWFRARAEGEVFNEALRTHVTQSLIDAGIQAVAPQLSSNWSWETSPTYGFASRWSERHAAHAAGLGTFGLCDGLITRRGKAHRVGSVVARLNIEATPRPYDNHRAWCAYFTGHGCMACAERCPVGAISEKGHEKIACLKYLVEVSSPHCKETYGFEAYGCGLCQTKVPCGNGIPAKILRDMERG